MIRKESGFTLIELLVVIAIIGILSSVVLASLNSARSKANNAKIKGQLQSARAAAEIYFDNNGTAGYGPSANDCTSGLFIDTVSGMKTYTTPGNYPGSPSIKCFSTANAYSISVPLSVTESGGDSWCVGSSGNSKAINASAVTSATSC